MRARTNGVMMTLTACVREEVTLLRRNGLVKLPDLLDAQVEQTTQRSGSPMGDLESCCLLLKLRSDLVSCLAPYPEPFRKKIIGEL